LESRKNFKINFVTVRKLTVNLFASLPRWFVRVVSLA
jgi:hypothetical protein